MSVVLDNDWFVATFPSRVEVTEEATDVAFAKTVDFSAEVAPFGLFSIRVTQMPLDPFLAVGVLRWVQTFGDHWPQKFAACAPQVMRDQASTPLGRATRELDLRLDYEGPCSAYVRLFALSDGDVGRIVVAAAVVGSTTTEEETARVFLSSVNPKWVPAG